MRKQIFNLIYSIGVLIFCMPFLLKFGTKTNYVITEGLNSQKQIGLNFSYSDSFIYGGIFFIILNLFTLFFMKEIKYLIFNFLIFGICLLPGFEKNFHYIGCIIIVTSIVLLKQKGTKD